MAKLTMMNRIESCRTIDDGFVRAGHGIDYLRFTIDYYSAFSATSVVDIRTPSHGDFSGFCLTSNGAVRIIVNKWNTEYRIQETVDFVIYYFSVAQTTVLNGVNLCLTERNLNKQSSKKAKK